MAADHPVKYGYRRCWVPLGPGRGRCMRRLHHSQAECPHHGRRRRRAEPDDAKVTLWIRPQIAAYVDQLIGTGLFGGDRAEVIDRLVCDRLIELMDSPLIELPRKQRKARR